MSDVDSASRDGRVAQIQVGFLRRELRVQRIFLLTMLVLLGGIVLLSFVFSVIDETLGTCLIAGSAIVGGIIRAILLKRLSREKEALLAAVH